MPSKALMDKETAAELQEKAQKGKPFRHFHKMGNAQWDYVDHLAELGMLPSLQPVLRQIYHDSHLRRRHNLMTYKQNNYVIKGPDLFDCSFGLFETSESC